MLPTSRARQMVAEVRGEREREMDLEKERNVTVGPKQNGSSHPFPRKRHISTHETRNGNKQRSAIMGESTVWEKSQSCGDPSRKHSRKHRQTEIASTEGQKSDLARVVISVCCCRLVGGSNQARRRGRQRNHTRGINNAKNVWSAGNQEGFDGIDIYMMRSNHHA